MPSSNFTKHTSSNPIQRWLIARFYRVIFSLLRHKPIATVLDAGCGEGFTLDKLRKERIGKTYIGVDVSREALATGSRMFPKFTMEYGDIHALGYRERFYDLVVCLEVLEHIRDPDLALREIARVTKRYVLLTVPWEPWFWMTNLLLGKYLATWGNHPEHINHWSRSGFVRLVTKNGLSVVHSTVSFPWIIILAKPG